MAATPSNTISLGTKANDFKLYSPIDNKELSLNELKGENGTLIIFMCNHCPYVLHIIEKVIETQDLYKSKGIQFIGINSNDAKAYPADSPEKMIEFSKAQAMNFPYLYDESQDVAKSYDAACTPDFFLYNKDMELVYFGNFDDARPKNDVAVTGENLKGAIDNMLQGNPPLETQIPSIGCNIKWKE